MIVAGVSACDRSAQRIEEATVYFDSGDFTSSRDLLLEHRLQTTPEGAELLAASYLALDEDAAALALVLNDKRRFSPTTRTDVCVVSMLGAREADEFELLRTRRDSCAEVADTARIDFQILSELSDSIGTTGGLAQLEVLVTMLNEAQPSAELDAAAGLVEDYGLRWVGGATSPEEKGERLVAAIEVLDTLEFRRMLVEVQLSLLETAPDDVARACLDAFREELGSVIADDDDATDRLQRLTERVAPEDEQAEQPEEPSALDEHRAACPVARLAD